jgi:uncharacterized protein (DUF58 family)
VIPVPTGKLLLLFILPLPLFIAGLKAQELLIAGGALDIALLLFAALDILRSIKQYKPVSEPVPPAFFSIGRENHLPVILHHRGPTIMELSLKIDTPESWEDQTEKKTLRIHPGQKERWKFTFRPLRRGAFHFSTLSFRINSAAGLFRIQYRTSIDLTIEVLPDVIELNQLLHFARGDRLQRIGIHRSRFQGMGTELEYLREYQPGEDAGRIDWKVTTRVAKPVIRVFQMERSNNITFVLDCGRMMTAEQDGLNTLDYAINSILILSHIALKMGDTVNLVAFSDSIKEELYGLKGLPAIKKIRSFAANLEPEYVESSYSFLFKYLRTMLKKRSYIMIFSDIIEDIQYPVLKKHIGVLNRKHLLLMTFLRDYQLMDAVAEQPSNIEELYRSTAARDLFMKRNHAIQKLKHLGIGILDILPKHLTPPLVNHYYELKARNAL